jgi:hypothetical protein
MLISHLGLALFLVISGAFAGLFGTWCMDRFGAVLRKRGIISGVSGSDFSKWLFWLARGKWKHTDISQSPAAVLSSRIAIGVHYGIGAVLGVVYACLHWVARFEQGILRTVSSASTDAIDLTWLSRLGFLPCALLYGLATCVFAWFLMFPSMGYGAFGARGPARLKLFRTSLINHAVYGIGLGIFLKVVQGFISF